MKGKQIENAVSYTIQKLVFTTLQVDGMKHFSNKIIVQNILYMKSCQTYISNFSYSQACRGSESTISFH